MGLLRKIFSPKSAAGSTRGEEPVAQSLESHSGPRSRAAAHESAVRHTDVLTTLRPALEAAPSQGDLILARASSLYAAGRYREARDACLRAAESGARHADFYQTLGWACLQTGRLADAEIAMRRAVELEPENCASHFGMGTVLRALKRHGEAAGSFERAVALQPTNVLYLINLADCYLDLDNVTASEALMRRAVAVDKDSIAAWSSLGLVLGRQARLEEAIEAYGRAERLERDAGAEAKNFVNFGLDLRESGNIQAALELFEFHLPDYPGPSEHGQYALALLGAGRLREGWSHLEFRWFNEPLNSDRLRSGRPVWCGQDLRGKTILLRVEQGFGDNIQFLRYAPALKALGATVLLGEPPGFEKIARLFPGIDEVFGSGTVVEFDYYIHANESSTRVRHGNRLRSGGHPLHSRCSDRRSEVGASISARRHAEGRPRMGR